MVQEESAPSTVESCQVEVWEYTDGACTTGGSSGGYEVVFSFSGWTDIVEPARTTAATTQSVLLRVRCISMSSPFSVLVDDIYFGPDLLVPVELRSLDVE